MTGIDFFSALFNVMRDGHVPPLALRLPMPCRGTDQTYTREHGHELDRPMNAPPPFPAPKIIEIYAEQPGQKFESRAPGTIGMWSRIGCNWFGAFGCDVTIGRNTMPHRRWEAFRL